MPLNLGIVCCLVTCPLLVVACAPAVKTPPAPRARATADACGGCGEYALCYHPDEGELHNQWQADGSSDYIFATSYDGDVVKVH